MAQIISLFQASTPPRRKQEWSTQDLAELYRVEATLVQAGLRVDTERGKSDEGDEWFAFCHADSGEVIVHFALIDGEYVVAAPALDNVLRGTSLDVIVRSFIAENPVSLPKPEDKRDGNVIFHPAALLTVFVATLLLTAAPDESFAAGARQASVAEPEATADKAGTDADAILDNHLDLDPSSNLRVETAKDHRSNEMALLLTVAIMASEMAHFQAEASEIADPAFALRDLSVASFSLAAPSDAVTVQEWGNPLDRAEFFWSSDEVPVGEAAATTAANGRPSVPVIEIDASLSLVLPEGTGAETRDALAPDSADGAVDAGTMALVLGDNDGALAQQAVDASAAAPGVNTRAASASASAPDRAEAETPRGWLESLEFETNFVESNRIAEAKKALEIVEEEQAEASADSAPGAHGEGGEFWNGRLGEFNEMAKAAIDHFLNSDEDIMVVERDDGSLVIFDQSDIHAGMLLDQHTWFFDDKMSLAIVGHVDAVSEALAVIA